MPAKQNIIISVSDAKISEDINTVLVTYSLGSCIAVTVYDPACRLGGMIHYQLPESSMDPQRAQDAPFMFADSGLTLLINKILQLGAAKSRLIVKAAGGAAMENGPKGFDIGKRNFLALRKMLWQLGVMLKNHDCGGTKPRNMYLDIETGSVLVKSYGTEHLL